jgi:hypothetical protein
MKDSLRFIKVIVFTVLSVFPLLSNGQTVLFSEDFSGFTGGSHSSPSTSDVSGSLDLKTSAPGWKGLLIYPAAGEIKIGTSSSAGWIETPLLNLPGEAGVIIKFDIARWVSDATTVKLFFNDSELGELLIPTDNFQTVQFSVPGNPTSGKIKIAGITKRFYLDNLVVTCSLPTGEIELEDNGDRIKIYPVPSFSELTLVNNVHWDLVEILDFNGKVLLSADPVDRSLIQMNIEHFSNGIYLIQCRKGNIRSVKSFIKAGN